DGQLLAARRAVSLLGQQPGNVGGEARRSGRNGGEWVGRYPPKGAIPHHHGRPMAAGGADHASISGQVARPGRKRNTLHWIITSWDFDGSTQGRQFFIRYR